MFLKKEEIHIKFSLLILRLALQTRLRITELVYKGAIYEINILKTRKNLKNLLLFTNFNESNK